MPPENVSPAEQAIIDELTKLNSRGGDRKDKQDVADAKRTATKNLKAVRDNGLALVGLTAGMFSLTAMIGNQLKMNSDLAHALGQTGSALKGVESATNRFIRGAQGTEQMIKVFSDAVDMGMTNFSDRTLQFGSQLKVLGLQNKTAFKLMRANTQGLGISETASLTLANELFSTAAANQDSMQGLIEAINSMKDAMISTTVELGPKAAMNAQKIAAMMSQGNSELQESSARFVKSFLAGSDGYMKAAKLGVQFTGKESTSEMARKFETILGKVQGLQAGKQGAGSQFFFDAMEKSFGLSREDFNLQTQIGTSIGALQEGNVEQLSKQSAAMNLQQTIWNQTEPFQNELLKVTKDFAGEINSILGKITEFNSTLGQYFLPITAGITSMLGFLGMGGIAGAVSTGGSLLKGLGGFFKEGWKKFGMEVATNPGGKTKGIFTGLGTALKGGVKGLVKGLGVGAKAIGKRIAPIAVAFEGISRGLETGSWIEGVKRAGVSAAIYGAGIAAAPFTMGTSLVAAAALDHYVGDAAADMIPGGEYYNQRQSLAADNPDMGRGDAFIAAMDRNTAVSIEILEKTAEGNEQRGDQTEAMKGEPTFQPIRAGAR